MGLLSIIQYYKKRPSRQIFNSNLYSINKQYSAINFIPPESNIRTQIEKETDLRHYYASSVAKKWFAVIILGLFIGTLGAVMALIVEEMFILKNFVLKETLKYGLIGSSFVWMVWTVFPIMICSFVVMEFAPTLRGCGIASATAYLNGVKLHNFHKASTLLSLYLSIFLISAANMPGGREELVIYLGALSGAFITRARIPFTNIRPFLSVSSRINMRTLVAAGTAAGGSIAFGTPIGAVLFCLEEGLSFWSPELTTMMFLCTICSNFVLHLFYTLYRRGKDFSYEIMPYLFFSGARHISLTYEFSEIPLFILMGIIGGLLGSFWNEGQIILRRWRNNNIKTKTLRYLEVAILGLCLSLCGILTFHYFGAECTQKIEKEDREARSSHMKVYCKEDDEFESVTIYLFQDLRHTIKSLLVIHKELISFSVVLFGGIYYYVFSGLQLGTYLPSGILIPHLICGASWGYLVGIWYSQASVAGNIIVSKYAFLGAVAQGSGVARLTLSLGIIMIESCGQQIFSLPIFIIVITAKWFGGIFSRPIYRIETYLEGYPFLRVTYLPISTPYKAKHIMISSMVSLPPRLTVKELVDALISKHQVFPVLENEKVVGVVTKYQIAVILKSKVYKFPDNIDKEHLMNEMLLEYEGESFVELEEVIHSEDSIPDAYDKVDLTNFMSASTYLINSAQGIITRKDIACFKKISQFMLMRTEVLPLRHWSSPLTV
ncbi:unnamed protein product [Nezara viridula]|uniref:Chloride channel protein n=1 Tax=Nezara viridula TaxID=85310 RepID=A0A9P0E814_NEZVI|nr:unnamed protein product [Nezara viridula]